MPGGCARPSAAKARRRSDRNRVLAGKRSGICGLIYVIFLPFIGFAMVAWLLAVKATHLAADVAHGAARALRPGWEPSMAFLSRTKPANAAQEGADKWAEEVGKKLNRCGIGSSGGQGLSMRDYVKLRPIQRHHPALGSVQRPCVLATL